MSSTAPVTLHDYPSKPGFYESWGQFGPFYTESLLIRTLTSVSNLNLTAYYHPFVIIVDGGWAAPTRDSQGKLQFDLQKFPSGTNILFLIHAYGCKGALWVEANGPDITPTTGTPSTSGANIEIDARTIAEWGFDGAKFDLITDGETGAKKVESVTRFINAFRGAASGRETYFYHDVGPGMARDEFLSFPPGAVICENSENDPGDIVYWTTTMLTHLQNVNKKNQWNCGREVYEARPEVPPKPRYNTSFVKVWSMFGSPYVFTGLTEGYWQDYKDSYTRTECIALNNDPLYAAPTPLIQSSTNVALMRQRADGTLTVLAFNMTTNHTQNFTFTFSQLGLSQSSPARVREIYTETDLGVYSGSYSTVVAPMQATLLTFDSEDRRPLFHLDHSDLDIGLTILARTNQTVVLEKSDDLALWTPFATNTAAATPWKVNYPKQQLPRAQFYRATQR